MSASPIPKLSVEEYLALDRVAEVPCEYHDGELFPIMAVTIEHGRITANTKRRLSERLDGKPCRVLNSPRSYAGLESAVRVETLDIALPLAEIYFQAEP